MDAAVDASGGDLGVGDGGDTLDGSLDHGSATDGDVDGGDAGSTSGCANNSECEAEDYCAFEEGCAGVGHCVPRPQICLPLPDLVCGCDDVTYDTDCHAASAGANVAAPGACARSCVDGTDCGRAEFCHTTGCRASGVCVQRPSCAIEDPVCGCDGVTYDTVCEAADTGVSVVGEGPCDVNPDDTCADNDDCSGNEFCRKRGCGATSGRCTQRPLCGIGGDDMAVVCGCDGSTYSDQSCAHNAGVNVDHVGECALDARR